MFRHITKADREEFLAMSREFYASEAVISNIPEEYHKKTFDELMRSDIYLICYIFELDGKVVGYALLNRCFNHEAGGEVVWLEELYIRADYQGRGIGGRFLDWLVENTSASRLRLETEPDNLRAKALYKNHGFEPLFYESMYRDLN